jgi:hypothetical protein
LTAVAKKTKKARKAKKAELESASGDRLLEEIRKLLDDVLVAQHRTNHLLELALRAGFDDEERARA